MTTARKPGPMRPVSHRLPRAMCDRLDAMASNLGVSRSRIIVEMIDRGFAATEYAGSLLAISQRPAMKWPQDAATSGGHQRHEEESHATERES